MKGFLEERRPPRPSVPTVGANTTMARPGNLTSRPLLTPSSQRPMRSLDRVLAQPEVEGFLEEELGSEQASTFCPW